MTEGNMSPDQYGNKYWCVKVPSNISQDGEIYVYGDTVEVTSNGELIFWREKEQERYQNLALASGSWLVFFAASFMDGSAVAVEHWKGEVIR